MRHGCPNVEKFSKEIGRAAVRISTDLKEQIGQESDYAGRMRDEKYEQELKVQKANQKIFELQRTNEQMGRLFQRKSRQTYWKNCRKQAEINQEKGKK